MKKTPALVASFAMTILVALIMVAVGAGALASPSSSASASTGTAAQANSADSAQVQQLQATIADYQAQLQQYQQVFTALQQRGLIRVDANGQVTILNNGSFSRGNR